MRSASASARSVSSLYSRRPRPTVRSASCSASAIICWACSRASASSRSASPWASARAHSASSVASATSLSRWSRTSWASSSSPGMASRTSSSSSSTSPRGTTQLVVIGSPRASSQRVTSSSSASNTRYTPDSVRRPSRVVGHSRRWSACHPSGEALEEAPVHLGVQERADVPAPAGDLLDQRAGDEGVGGVGDEEDRVDAGLVAVHLRHRLLEAEVGGRPQALDEGRGADRPAVVDDEALERVGAHVVHTGQGRRQQLPALVDREHALLGGVHRDGY